MRTLTNLKFKDEDDGGEEVQLEFINIEVVKNGFIVISTYDDGEEEKEVFDHNTGNEMLRSLKQRMGLDG